MSKNKQIKENRELSKILNKMKPLHVKLSEAYKTDVDLPARNSQISK